MFGGRILYILKDMKCRHCGKDIAVYPFNDFDDGGRPVVIVDYGECLGCLSRVVLPGDEFGPFVRKNCVKTSFI